MCSLSVARYVVVFAPTLALSLVVSTPTSTRNSHWWKSSPMDSSARQQCNCSSCRHMDHPHRRRYVLISGHSTVSSFLVRYNIMQCGGQSQAPREANIKYYNMYLPFSLQAYFNFIGHMLRHCSTLSIERSNHVLSVARYVCII